MATIPNPIPLPRPVPPTPPTITTTTTTATTSTTSSPSVTSTTSTSISTSTSPTESTVPSTTTTTTRPPSRTPSPIPTATAPTLPTPDTSTVIEIVSTTSSRTPSASTQTNSSTPFFQNKGAVAGLFTVLGLIGVAVIIALLTNFVRRRRALKFDRDVAAAAAEAARAPVILDDDYNDHYPYDQIGSQGGPAHSYSEMNQGLFNDPSKPLDYPMAEMHNAIPSSQAYPAYGAGAGAAGVGAAMTRDKSMRGLSDSYGHRRGSVLPHAAMYDSSSGSQARRSGYDLDSVTYAESNPSTSPDHSRSRSIGARYSTGPFNSRPSQEGYGPSHDSFSSQNQRGYQPDAYKASSSPFADVPAASAPMDPYGGYVEGDPNQPQPRRLSAPLSNPYASRTSSVPSAASLNPTAFGQNRLGGQPRLLATEDNVRNSFRDEEDYEIERGHRVLKVANE